MAESEAKGHGKRLEQPQDKLVIVQQELKDAKGRQAKLFEQVDTLGPAGQRADRDFRSRRGLPWPVQARCNAAISIRVSPFQSGSVRNISY